MAKREGSVAEGGESAAAVDRPSGGEADAADAERFRSANEAGRVMADIPLYAIDADALVRDRMVLDRGELDELRRSILDHGLRLPVEVYATGPGAYGLISGYRRLLAVRSIQAELGLPGYETIRAVIRDPAEIGGAVVAMVEENEVRAQLSPYERGRIAVIAAEGGGFANTEAALAGLFASASKGKRSKIRSFAMIHEELGDLLDHADRITERDGLRIAGMLRQDGEARLRAALEDGPFETFEAEWAAIEPVLRAHELALVEGHGRAGPAAAARRASRGGRPRKEDVAAEVLSSGIRLEQRRVEGGFALTVTGRGMDREMMDALMRQVRYLLEKP